MTPKVPALEAMNEQLYVALLIPAVGPVVLEQVSPDAPGVIVQFGAPEEEFGVCAFATPVTTAVYVTKSPNSAVV